MLDALFRPKAVAVIGAGRSTFSIGNIVLRNLVQNGFCGPIFPVNPHGGQLRGLTVYPRISDVPGDVDLVNISVHRDHIESILCECAEKNVKFAVVHSAGFKEMGGDGVERERRLLQTARKCGIRIVGPNCQGVQNSDPDVRLYANFTFTPMKPGKIAIAAQAGGLGETLQLHLHRAGLGYAMYASYGNQSDVDVCDVLSYYAECPRVKLIVLQLETMHRVERFIQTVRNVRKTKPISALVTGRTEPGRLAADAHTGVARKADLDAEKLLHSADVACFRDTSALIRTVQVAAMQPAVGGKRLAIVTNSGGPAVQAVDVAVENGLQIARLSSQSQRLLSDVLASEASIRNPVDLVATASPEHYRRAIQTVVADPGVDALLVFFVAAAFVDTAAVADGIAEVSAKSGKPIVVTLCSPKQNTAMHQRLQQAGIPVFDFVEHAVQAVATAKF